MKRLLIASVCLLPFTAYHASAAAYVNAPLNAYLAPGFSCLIGNDTVVSNLSYTRDGSTGADTPAASSVSVMPQGTASSGIENGQVGITFGAIWSASSANSIADAQLSFTAASNDGDIIQRTLLQMAGTAQRAGASASVTKTAGGTQIAVGTNSSATATANVTPGMFVKSQPPTALPSPIATVAPPTPVTSPSAPASSVAEPGTLSILALAVAVIAFIHGCRRTFT